MDRTEHRKLAETLAGPFGSWYYADRADVPQILQRAQIHATLAQITDPDDALNDALDDVLTRASEIRVQRVDGVVHVLLWNGAHAHHGKGATPAEALAKAREQFYAAAVDADGAVAR